MPKSKPKTNSQSSALQRPAPKLEIISIAAPKLVEVEQLQPAAETEATTDLETAKAKTPTKNKTKADTKSVPEIKPEAKAGATIEPKTKTKATPKPQDTTEVKAIASVEPNPKIKATTKTAKTTKTQDATEVKAIASPETQKIAEAQTEITELPSIEVPTTEQLPANLPKAETQGKKPDAKKAVVSTPIQELNFPCQALGMVFGRYAPNSPEVFTKGVLIFEQGVSYGAYVLAKALRPMQRKVDIAIPHSYLVYPKTSRDNNIWFDILAVDIENKIQGVDNNQFNIRGQIIGQFSQGSSQGSKVPTEQPVENTLESTESNMVAVDGTADNELDSNNDNYPDNNYVESRPFFLVQINRNPDYLKPKHREHFTIKVLGTLPENLLRQFVYVRCELVETNLHVVSYEHLACPLPKPRKSYQTHQKSKQKSGAQAPHSDSPKPILLSDRKIPEAEPIIEIATEHEIIPVITTNEN